MFDVQRVQKSWHQEVDEINELVCDLSEAEAQSPIREDGWTAQDILQHVTGSARSFMLLMRPPEAGGITLSSAFDRDGWNAEQRTRNAERPWNATRQYWTKTTQEITQVLASLTPEAAEGPITIPWLPAVANVGDMLRVLILHTRSHRGELVTGLQALAMRNS